MSFTLGDHRILPDHVEELGEGRHTLVPAREHRRQVEAEAVHVHLAHPVPQTVHHELDASREWRMSTVLPVPVQSV